MSDATIAFLQQGIKQFSPDPTAAFDMTAALCLTSTIPHPRPDSRGGSKLNKALTAVSLAVTDRAFRAEDAANGRFQGGGCFVPNPILSLAHRQNYWVEGIERYPNRASGATVPAKEAKETVCGRVEACDWLS